MTIVSAELPSKRSISARANRLASSSRPECSKRTATALTYRHADVAALGTEHGRGIDVREERALHAARHESDPRARAAVFGPGERRNVTLVNRQAAAAARRAAPTAAANGLGPDRRTRACSPLVAYASSGNASRRNRAGYGINAKINARNTRSNGPRCAASSTFARVDSISTSYCTPDGHAVTHAMQPRHASTCADRSRHRARSRRRAHALHQIDAPARRNPSHRPTTRTSGTPPANKSRSARNR